MGSIIHPPEGIEIDGDRKNFEKEHHPFGGPGKDEIVDQKRGGRGIDQADDEPDADPGETSVNEGQEHKEFRKIFGEIKNGRALFPKALSFGQYKVKPSPDGELADKDMGYGDDGNQGRTADGGEVPDGIIHKRLPESR
ncbi:MAG: hypothetical protein P8Y63_11235 [Deltaproteobacteria bacterium]